MLKCVFSSPIGVALSLAAFASACSSDPASDGNANTGGAAGSGGSSGSSGSSGSAGEDLLPGELNPHRRVMIIGLDGVRPDALQAAETPRMDGLIANGAVSFTASTQLTGRTSSGPGWTSILTGVEVEKHGVVENSLYDDFDRSYHTVIRRAQDELGARISMASHWPDIVNGIVETEYRGEIYMGFDEPVADHVAEIVGQDTADLYFVQLDDIDDAGHTSGFDVENPEYIDAIELTDEYVGRIIDAVDARPADEEWLFLMTTDHGGTGRFHGAQDEANQTIWVIVSADGVVQGKLNNATHMDLHPTALAWLGAVIDPDWGLDGTVQGLPTE
jgi:predicted AlkP superfamily pyrophosphatase or phosphodiesterase